MQVLGLGFEWFQVIRALRRVVLEKSEQGCEFWDSVQESHRKLEELKGRFGLGWTRFKGGSFLADVCWQELILCEYRLYDFGVDRGVRRLQYKTEVVLKFWFLDRFKTLLKKFLYFLGLAWGL